MSRPSEDTVSSPMSSGDSSCPPRCNGSGQAPHRRLLLCEVEPLPHKSVAQEIRGHKDLRRVADFAPIVLKVSPTSPDRVIHSLLFALVDAGLLPLDAVGEATDALIGHEPSDSVRRDPLNSEDAFDSPARPSMSAPLLPVVQVPDQFSEDFQGASRHTDSLSVLKSNTGPAHWRRHILGQGFIIPFARISGFNKDDDHSVVAIAQLTSNTNLGTSNDTMVRFVAVVLGPMREVKETKTPFEVARTLASLFQDDTFILTARLSEGDDAFRGAILDYLKRQTNAKVELNNQSEKLKVDTTFARTGRFAGGLVADIKRRYRPRSYLSDWTDGLLEMRALRKYLSAIVWLYFAIVMSTIAFGALNEEDTDGDIGVIETLVSQAFAGIVFAVFSGQPLAIAKTTPPMVVFIDVLYKWSISLGIPFLPFYAWTGIWTAIVLVILVVTDACFIMKYCGHFTEEIFAMLIAALFISEYIHPLVETRHNKDEGTEVFLLVFLLATGTFLIAKMFLNFRRSFLTKPVVRDLLSDFGVPIAILTMTAARRAFMNVELKSLKLPEEIGLSTSNGRSWFVQLFDIKVQHILLASVSGVLLATLLFLIQNIASMLVNKPENKLEKGPGYYLDLLVLSGIIIVQSLLGMPWVHAALPYSPLHARQIADVEEYEEHGRRYERVVKARETRWTGLLTHVLIGLSILAKDALKLIPLAVLFGFLLFLGICTLDGNALWDRIVLIFTQPEKYPPNHFVRRVKIQRIHLYTLIQVSLLVLLWFVMSNFYITGTVFNTGLLFPVVIALFIPIRLYILPLIFSASELQALSVEEGKNVSDSGVTV